MITEVESKDDGSQFDARYGAVARVELMGEIVRDNQAQDSFSRGVSAYPAIGDPAGVVGRDELRLVYAGSEGSVTIGTLHHDETIPARVSLDNLLKKHFAVIGSTGVGKSSGIAVILNAILEARPELRIFLLDGHNEYGRCFGALANVVNSGNLKLPFWMFNFEELVDVIYGGRASVDEEIDILSEQIPVAKSMYPTHRSSADRTMRRPDPKRLGFTVDTPVPYQIQDLVNLIDERMGKLENRAMRMHYHRLLARIDHLRADMRYAFMFDNANVGGDTMSDILSHLFRLEPNGKPMTVMQIAGLPAEVVDAVVCVVTRLAFDFGLWSDGEMPMLFVCEEAHRFAPADKAAGFAPTRRALLRIAKEGRKYGVYLGLVTQRPGELDPTIISQCNTLFAMRLANDRDQSLLRSAVTDAIANLLAFVPSLGTREVVAFGEGVPLPARLRFSALPKDRLPQSETFNRGNLTAESGHEKSFVKSVVERWRSASGAPRTMQDEGSLAQHEGGGHQRAFPTAAAPGSSTLDAKLQSLVAKEADPELSDSTSVSSRLDHLRAQILNRASNRP